MTDPSLPAPELGLPHKQILKSQSHDAHQLSQCQVIVVDHKLVTN